MYVTKPEKEKIKKIIIAKEKRIEVYLKNVFGFDKAAIHQIKEFYLSFYGLPGCNFLIYFWSNGFTYEEFKNFISYVEDLSEDEFNKIFLINEEDEFISSILENYNKR